MLNDGIKTGYQSFWNILYGLSIPLNCKIVEIRKNNDPNIIRKRLRTRNLSKRAFIFAIILGILILYH